MRARKIYVVIQEGGSSMEHYASGYDTAGDALNAMKGHTRATYRSKGPFPITVYEDPAKPKAGHPVAGGYFREEDVYQLISDIALERFEYVDGVTVGAEEED